MPQQTARKFDEPVLDWELERMIPGSRVAMPKPPRSVGDISNRSHAQGNSLHEYFGGFKEKSALGNRARRKVLIVGAGAIGRSVAHTLRREGRTEVCGFVDDARNGAPEVLGRIEDLPWLARAEFIDEVIVALPAQSLAATAACEIAQRNHLDIRSAIALPEGSWPDATVDRICQVPVISLHREILPYGKLFLKRMLDVLGALIGFALLGPVMALLALLIRLDSPGPAIYAAERVGMRGRRFRCFKFRSMINDANRLQEDLRGLNQREGPIFKIANDPRITRIGGFLRHHSLDELPQLWNVLRGDMSLVGPRPHPVEDVERYDLHDYRRLDMKPGMTGLWQVTARGNPSFELSMHLDLTYIENWTPLLDLRILLLTLRELLHNAD